MKNIQDLQDMNWSTENRLDRNTGNRKQESELSEHEQILNWEIQIKGKHTESIQKVKISQ